MRIFTKAKPSLKPNLQNLESDLLNVRLKPRRKSKKKNSKSKSKMGKYVKQSFLEWLEKMLTPEAIEMFKPYGESVLKLLMQNLKGGRRVSKSASCDAGKPMAAKDENIHE